MLFVKRRVRGLFNAVENILRVENRNILPSLGGLNIAFDSLDYCTPGDSRREMLNDLNTIKRDLKKSIDETKRNIDNGKTSTAK